MDPRRTKHCRGWGSEPDFLHDARGQLTLFLIIVLIQVWPNEPSLRQPPSIASSWYNAQTPRLPSGPGNRFASYWPRRQKAGASARVRTLAEDQRQALMQIGVMQGPANLGTADFQDHGHSPHGFYRALILPHGQRVTWPPKWAFTREYGHRSHC